MNTDLSHAQRFSFVKRPLPVPGDLRITWRTSLILLMLHNSRAKRASLAKLHVVNCAVRSSRALNELKQMLAGGPIISNWQLRVEPAFGRAIDFAVGHKLVAWVFAAQRASLQLTAAGVSAADDLSKHDDVLREEKAVLSEIARSTTEKFVSDLLAIGRSRP
jgi:hypothetical protein